MTDYTLPQHDKQITNCTGDLEGLSIINRNGLYHIHYTTDLVCLLPIVPLVVCKDQKEVERNLKAFSRLLTTKHAADTLRLASYDYSMLSGMDKLNELSKEEIIGLANKMNNAITEVVCRLMSKHRFGVVKFSKEGNEIADQIVAKTRTLSDAIAWIDAINEGCEVVTDYEPDAAISWYEVYRLNHLHKRDGKPVYQGGHTIYDV